MTKEQYCPETVEVGSFGEKAAFMGTYTRTEKWVNGWKQVPVYSGPGSYVMYRQVSIILRMTTWREQFM